MTTITKMKQEARENYLAYQRIQEQYNCGHNLLVHISGRAAEHWNKYTGAMNWLRENDPDCPSGSSPAEAEQGDA